MKYKVRSLQKALPFYYFLVLFLTFTILVSSFCVYYLKNLRTSEYNNLKNLSRSITSVLQQEIESMSSVSMNMIYSKSINEGISYLGDSSHSAQELYTKKQEIHNTMFDFIGLQPNIAQVNIYPSNGKALGTGLYTYQKDSNLVNRPWYADAVEKDGERYMTLPQPLSYYISPSPFANDLQYISLVRLYYDKGHEIKGAIEVLQSCSNFFAAAEETLVSNPDISIYVVNAKQELVYPLDESAKESALYYNQKFQNDSLTNNSIHLVKDQEKKRHAIIQTTIPSVGWNIYITEPDSVIYDSLKVPIVFFVFILILVLVLTFWICLTISNRILLPLQQLQNAFKIINLDNLLDSSADYVPLPESHYSEIKTLITSFQIMYKKLNRSTTLLIQSREEEIRAKEIATQSLMKPHFLYNNLANISIMAEENMNQEIITLTENLCDYLRYTSAAGTNKVSIQDEFFYTEKYLLCMKVRYKERLQYQFSLEKSIQNITVPKLILQPLVENALKYAFYKNPPWVLHISGFSKEDFWCISVCDNGVGFSEDIREEVFKNLGKIKKTQDISQLKIGGMGLSNVYLRLLLMYGSEIIFQIQKNKGSGTCITIGGKLKYDNNSESI